MDATNSYRQIAEALRDEIRAGAATNAEHYVRRTFRVKAGGSLKVHLAPGGGFAARFMR